MFAFKLKPGAAEFLAPVIHVPDVAVVEGVTYYAIVDPILTQKIVTEEELRALEIAEGEEYIIFE